MIYKSPKIGNSTYWVPIVAKNKDYLSGYIMGSHNVEDIIVESLNNAGMNVNGLDLDLCLDSSRFNDILENGRRESDLNDTELTKYYEKMIKDKFAKFYDKHPDNDPSLLHDYFLTVECPCGIGIYSFSTPQLIPDKRFKCTECGRILIDYTNHDDFEYEFDGHIEKRND